MLERFGDNAAERTKAQTTRKDTRMDCIYLKDVLESKYSYMLITGL